MSDYLETHAVHAEVVDQSAERKKRLEHLESCYGAQCEVLTAQATEIKRKDEALDDAAAEVERLEGLFQTSKCLNKYELATRDSTSARFAGFQ
jgi:DNA repair ATPase RecN